MRPARHQAADAVVHRHVGAAKPVDRLLWIADQCELTVRENHVLPAVGTGLAFAQVQDDFGLQRVRVLEFIHEDVVEHSLVVTARFLVPGQQVAQLDEEVELIELTAPSLDFLVLRQNNREEAHEPGRHPAVDRRTQVVSEPIAIGLPHLPCLVIPGEGMFPGRLFLRRTNQLPPDLAGYLHRVVTAAQPPQSGRGFRDPIGPQGASANRRGQRHEFVGHRAERGSVERHGGDVSRRNIAPSDETLYERVETVADLPLGLMELRPQACLERVAERSR